MTIQYREARVDRAYQVPLFEQASPLGPVDKAGAVATLAAPANLNHALDERYIAWRQAGSADTQTTSSGALPHGDLSGVVVAMPPPVRTTYVVNAPDTPGAFKRGDNSTNIAPDDIHAEHQKIWDRGRYHNALAIRIANLSSLPDSTSQNPEQVSSEGSEEPQPDQMQPLGHEHPHESEATDGSYDPPFQCDAAGANTPSRVPTILEAASNTLTVIAMVALGTIALLLDPRNQSAQALSLSQENSKGVAGHSIITNHAPTSADEYYYSEATTPNPSIATLSKNTEPEYGSPILKVAPKEVLHRRERRIKGDNFNPNVAMTSVLNERHSLSLATSTQLSQLAVPLQNAEPFRPILRESLAPSTVEDGYVEDEGKPKIFDTDPAPNTDGSAVETRDPEAGAERSPTPKPRASIRPAIQPSKMVAAKKVARPRPHRPTRHKVVAPRVPNIRFADLCSTAKHQIEPTCSYWPFDFGAVFCPLFDPAPRSCTEVTTRRKMTRATRKTDPYVSVHDVIMAALAGP